MIEDRHKRIKLLRSAFQKVQQSADGKNVACYCPKCAEAGKRKLKLAIMIDDGRFHCWVCGTKGGSISSLIRRYKRELAEDAEKLWPRKNRKIVESIPDAPTNVTLPAGFELLSRCRYSVEPLIRSVYKYVRHRGLSDDDMLRYRLGVTTHEKFAERVIIPSFDASGHLNYYTTRAIHNRTFPRYVNADGRKQSIIYNEIDINWNEELTLVEGPFDVFKTVGNVTCLFGNSLDEKFLLFHKIVENETPVVLALDDKEDRQRVRIARLLYRYDIPVRILSVRGFKDVGEMTRKDFVERLKEAQPWSPTSHLRQRISQLNTNRGLSLSGTIS